MVAEVFRLFQHHTCEISINLSVEDILNEETIQFLFDTLIKYNITDRVVLEITENEGCEHFTEILSLSSTLYSPLP